MPKRTVTSPDGVQYIVNAPDGATDEDILTYARQSFTASGPATAADKNAVASIPLIGKYLPVNEVTASVGSALVGAGRAADKIAEGDRQIGLSGKVIAKNALGMDTKPDLQALAQQGADQRSNDAAYAGLRRERPFSTGVGEALPAVGIPMGQATMAGRVIAPALGYGGIEAAQYGTPQQRAFAGARGTVLGGVGGIGGEVANTILSPATSRLTASQQSALTNAADRIGVVPLPSQMTGNPVLARVEDYLSRVQGGAGVMQDFNAANKQSVNRVAARAMGQDAGAVDQGVFAGAKADISQNFDALRSQTTMPVTQPVFDAINNSQAKLRRGLGSVAGKSEALTTLDELKDRLYNSKQLSGDDYKSIVSDLSTAARETKNDTIASAYKEVQKAMDKVAMGPNAPAWAEANQQHAARKILSQPGVTNEITGDVNPVRLGTVMGQQYGEGMKTGAVTGPLADLAAYGKALPPMRAGSPTAERQAIGSPMDWLLSPAYWAAAKGMTSGVGRDYLSKGLLGNPAASRNIGILAQRGSLPFLIDPMQAAMGQMGLLGYLQ